MQLPSPVGNSVRKHVLCAALASFLAVPSWGTAIAAPKPIAPPEGYLSWNAPAGEPLASRNLVPGGLDSTAADQLYLSIRVPRNIVPLVGLSGTLLFEPEDGDTLGAFWDFERGGANAGSLQIDFDKPGTAECTKPWNGLVTGHVGYSRAGGRGRLDLSADVTPERAHHLVPSGYYLFARVTVPRTRCALPGCHQPVRITWVGGNLRSSRPGSESIWFGRGPERSVTWNAPPRGMTTRNTRLAVETWVPRFAPPSRKSIQVLESLPPQSE